ncbi:beta-glucosidase 5 [Xylogone sp. PMI_703]|nr:beta-glucosidase 5 [Xylogone sp. PMI_703]
MKGSIFAVAAAAIAGGVNGHAHRRHAHEAFHLERGLYATAPAPVGTAISTGVSGGNGDGTCGCTTVYYTSTGEPTLVHPTTVPSSSSSVAPPPAPTTSSEAAPVPTSTSPVIPPVIVPSITTCSTTGVYTFPATTVTLTETTTVCGAATTKVPSGTHTVGGVTTVVETATTVVCPYATVTTSEGVVTSTILTTTYVCPAAGTYTIGPITTTVSESTVLVYPTPASYEPGVYTQPELTTTITESNFVYVCPFTSSGAEALPTTTSAAPPPPPPTTTSVAPAPVKSSASSAPAPVSTSSSSGSSSGSGPKFGGSQSGKQWAITFTPYNNDGTCMSADQVEQDIADIASKGFTTVRVYSTDCSTLQNVGSSCKKHGLTMIIGIFIQTTIQDAQEQVQQIVEWSLWEIVELIVIGNESIFNGKCTAGELASFISSCSATFKSAGYSGQITTTEPLNIWQESFGELCGVVDVVGSNVYAFFNPTVLPAAAGTFIAAEMALLDALCPGKTSVNLECGWPHGGNCIGDACPGKSEQQTAIQSILAAVGEKTVLFSYTDDLWKAPGQYGVEQSWGLGDLF